MLILLFLIRLICVLGEGVFGRVFPDFDFGPQLGEIELNLLHMVDVALASDLVVVHGWAVGASQEFLDQA